MSAIISDCGHYRYRLERGSNMPGSTAIIMVNPSTADAVENDATIRKLMGFGSRNDWGKLIIGNLFAYRAKDVRELGRVADPVGPENMDHLIQIFADCDQAVFAWGPVSKQPRLWQNRWKDVASLVATAGLIPLQIGPSAKCGHPKHPLMLPYESPILPWVTPEKEG